MDFKKTLIDLSQTDESVVKKFASLHPDLDSFVSERKDELSIETAKLIRYIVACYDKESPIVYAYKKRWIIKKRESAIFAKLPQTDKGRFTEDVDALIFCQNDVVNKIILKYLYLMHDRLYQRYVVYNEMQMHQSNDLIKYNFAQPSHAKVAKDNLDQLEKDIEELEVRIFSGEEVQKMKELLYEEAYNIFNDLRPEKIVQRLEQGLPAVDFNPYGNYKTEKMTFMGDE